MLIIVLYLSALLCPNPGLRCVPNCVLCQAPVTAFYHVLAAQYMADIAVRPLLTAHYSLPTAHRPPPTGAAVRRAVCALHVLAAQ